MTAALPRVLITGATGFIGSALARFLSDRGFRLFCPVRPDSPGIKKLEMLDRLELLPVSPDSGQTWARSLKPIRARAVFHLASYGVSQADRRPEALTAGNGDLLCRILQAVADWPLQKFIFTGSCSEYAPSHGAAALKESWPLQPVSLYGAAKASAFLFGNALARHYRIPFFNARLFGVYGPGEAPERLIPYLIHRLHHHLPAELTAGMQQRDLLYVDDVAEALFSLLQTETAPPYQAYNICSGVALTIRHIGRTVARCMGGTEDLLHWGAKAYRADEAMVVVGDNQRFRSCVPWEPKVDLERGIQIMISRLTAKPAPEPLNPA